MLTFEPSPEIEKQISIMNVVETKRRDAGSISVSVELMNDINWKPPKGTGWSKTTNLEIAIKKATSKLHAIVTGVTGDFYYYK